MFSSPATHSPPSHGIDHNPSVETPPDNVNSFKRKRRPAGTPDPEAEVVALSPRTLMESDRYVCEICGQGFQRDQNLQMHRRRHKVPWKLLKRSENGAGEAAKKRVFVCPEPSCLHHDPCHALGDLVGIKKHFRRKHSTHKQWSCSKCSKAYAVQSDFKAHLKTCGTRGHSCDCGRVFSRVESFIEHQDACNAGRARTELRVPPPPLHCLSRTASNTSPSSDTNISTTPTWPAPRMPNPTTLFLLPNLNPTTLFLLPNLNPSPSSKNHAVPNTELHLHLSVGPANNQPTAEPTIVKEAAMDKLTTNKARADETRLRAKQQVELAEAELANAKKIRQQAHAELSRALAMREQATKKINAILLEITCQSCKQRFRAMASTAEDSSIAASYISSVVIEGEGGGDDQHHHHLSSSSLLPCNGCS